MKKLNTIAIVLLLSYALVGCYKNPIDSEQYFNQVYIVGAVNQIYSPTVPFSDQDQEVFISVAMGGSKNADRDVHVTLGVTDSSVIDIYNTKYIALGDIRYRQMPPSTYSIQSLDAVIKAGEVYTRVPVKINTAKFNCDSLYAIPFKIISSDLPINKSDSILLLSMNLTNNYSGTYQLTGTYVKWVSGATSGVPLAITASRTVKAVNQYAVRFFNKTTQENRANIASQCVVLTVNPTDNSVAVSGWGTLVITQGGGTYDPVSKAFTLWYNYMDTGTEYRMNVVLSM
jgi:hypothetical protein